MKITRESPEDSGVVTGAEAGGFSIDGFTPESIQRVRDFTARKTLEQAHAFVSGLARLFGDADPDEQSRALLSDLESVGISPHDAEQMAAEALRLIDLMADRDKKAEIFHSAVKEAGQSERAMYERLVTLARVLRAKLGNRTPDLGKLGVPPDPDPAGKPRSRPRKDIFTSAAVIK